MFKIYKIYNKKTRKSYIGMTGRSIRQRFMEHCCKYRNSQMFITKCINKEGKNNFIVSELRNFESKREAQYFERYYMILNNSLFPNGYNLSCKGDDVAFIQSKVSGKQLELL